VTRLLAYHVAPEIRQGLLQVVLADAEPVPLPVHIISPYGRLSVPKVRAFVDFALPRLRSRFTSLAKEAATPPAKAITTRRAKVFTA
jgi:DNA-binding transcriptional LysR family regulator